MGWYPFMDYEYPRSGSTRGKRQGLWKTINLEDESLHNRILRALSSSIYPTMVGGIFIFKVFGLLKNAFAKFSLPTSHDMIISHTPVQDNSLLKKFSHILKGGHYGLKIWREITSVGNFEYHFSFLLKITW